jgi:hypothetical protein
MAFDIRWEDQCLRELEEIYGDLRIADAAIFSIDWRLARNPLMQTWEIKDGSGVRLAWVKSYRGYPAVYLSFKIDLSGPRCVMCRAKRANDPLLS